jgi:hypothetical protein
MTVVICEWVGCVDIRMSEFLHIVFHTVISTVTDVIPIALIIFAFQYFVIRRWIAQLRRVMIGFVYVLLGLSLFLIGLEEALFPLGKLMAQQLADPAFVSGGTLTTGSELGTDYILILLFGASIGCATALAEPSLIAVAAKANQVSGGTIGPWGLRVAVAIGAAAGVAVGVIRIIIGIPLQYIVIGAYIVVIIQTFTAPRAIIPLAYDSGGVTTSTVTVPVVTALGLGLASTIPGRDPFVDGFGMIATTCLFPIITVMTYAQLGQWWSQRSTDA